MLLEVEVRHLPQLQLHRSPCRQRLCLPVAHSQLAQAQVAALGVQQPTSPSRLSSGSMHLRLYTAWWPVNEPCRQRVCARIARLRLPQAHPYPPRGPQLLARAVGAAPLVPLLPPPLLLAIQQQQEQLQLRLLRLLGQV